MPRRSKPARLWERPARWENGRKIAEAVWIIKDAGRHISTGCVASPAEKNPPAAAEQALRAYIEAKYSPERTLRDVGVIDIADVLSIYHDDTRDRQFSPKQFDGRIGRLNQFFGGRTLGQINNKIISEFVKSRKNTGGARRDLEDLRAAINHHAKQRFHTALIHIPLPDKGPGRHRWLDREEAARLLWVCWKYREQQLIHRGSQKGQQIQTAKYPLRHLTRFILIGLYTGTRSAAILSASPIEGDGRSFVNLQSGIFHRLAKGKRKTNKRQPPVRLPRRLLAHMRRWTRIGTVKTHFVEWNGSPVSSVKVAFKSAVKKAGLSAADGNVSPHTLRHTAATWLMEKGIDPWQASGFLGMSVKTLLDTYGHHHPNFMEQAAEAITSKGRNQNVVVVESVVEINRRRRK